MHAKIARTITKRRRTDILVVQAIIPSKDTSKCKANYNEQLNNCIYICLLKTKKNDT